MSQRSLFWSRSIPSSAEAGPSGWSIYPLIKDYSGCMGSLSVYYSVLSPGHIPHEMHQHPQEEIEVVFSGALELLKPDYTAHVATGGFHYQAPGTPHTIKALGKDSTRFIVIKWTVQRPKPVQQTPEHWVFNPDSSACGTERGQPTHPVVPAITLANGVELQVIAAQWPPETGQEALPLPCDTLVVPLNEHVQGEQNFKAPAVLFFPAGMKLAAYRMKMASTKALHFRFFPTLDNINIHSADQPDNL